LFKTRPDAAAILRAYPLDGEKLMRKIIVSTFLSLDGVMEDPGGSEGSGHGAWTFPYWNDETAAFKTAEMVDANALLLGRVTYEAFAAAWAGSSAPGSAEMNAFAKHVVTGTLTSFDWHNSHRLNGDLVEAVTALKGQDGKNILVYGSAMLAGTLLSAGLVDELRLLVYPVSLGSGKRLFPTGVRLPLRLASSTTFSTGVLALVYAAG
jgi:dihydrofolate reductase